MKGKLLICGIIFIALFGFFTRTFYVSLSICFALLSIYVLYKIYTRNNPYKKKISIAQDFLKHKYGEKMGNYILKESVAKNKGNKKRFLLLLFAIGFFLCFLMVSMPSVDAIDEMTFGEPNYASTNTSSWNFIEHIDTNKIVNVYNKDNTKHIYANVGIISGMDISYGNEYYLIEGVSDTATIGRVSKLSTNKFVIVYRNDTDGGVCYGVVCSVSGTVITKGNHYNISGVATGYNMVSGLSSDKFIVQYILAGDSSYTLQSIVVEVSGTTITGQGTTNTDIINVLPRGMIGYTGYSFLSFFVNKTTNEYFVKGGSISGTTIIWNSDNTTITTDTTIYHGFSYYNHSGYYTFIVSYIVSDKSYLKIITLGIGALPPPYTQWFVISNEYSIYDSDAIYGSATFLSDTELITTYIKTSDGSTYTRAGIYTYYTLLLYDEIFVFDEDSALSQMITIDSTTVLITGKNIILTNFVFNIVGIYTSGINNIYLKIYDMRTSQQLNVFDDQVSLNNLEGNDPSVKLNLLSDLWFGDYGHGRYYEPITIETTFTNGEYHWINLTNCIAYVDGESVTFYANHNNLQLYDGQTYSLYLARTEPYIGYENCKDGWWYSAKEITTLCIKNQFLIQGESVSFRYKTPTDYHLYMQNIPSDNYYLWLYDIENLGWVFHLTDGGESADNWDYINNYKLSLDNQWHELYWAYDPAELSGYKTVVGGVDHYKAYIGHGGGGWFGLDTILVEVDFFIRTGIYTPFGNITSVSPDSPELGQRFTISFDVNNNGYMTIRNLLAPQESETRITDFNSFSGTKTVNHTLWDYGEYIINLYVSGGTEYTSVDSYLISVTTLNGTYGGFGYNVEFLTCEPARAIAGFDTVFVNYRSLSENGTILITDSRGQQTPFSTFIGVKTGVLNISLPNYAEIGEWNLTLIGNDTLYSSFHVVAEENNWVEFNKNIFYPNGVFEIELKHDRKVELVFYKDGVAYGQDWFLDVGVYASGIYSVPIDKATPELGEWRVELWEVNNFIKIQKLAEDTCIVIELPPEDMVIEPPPDAVVNYLANIDPFYKGLIGIFIVLLCTFMPFIAIRKLGEHGVNFKVDVPPMLYTICCGVGSVVALILGLWQIEYTFFICVMAGFGTFALYLIGKRNGNG